jgi:hypothetical protein
MNDHQLRVLLRERIMADLQSGIPCEGQHLQLLMGDPAASFRCPCCRPCAIW